MNPHDTLAQRRARESLPDAIRASQQARAQWWQQQSQEPRRCIGCGAQTPIDYEPGQPLPCGH